MKRLAAAGLFISLIGVGSMLLALPAQATSPRVEQGSFTFPVDEVDTQLCGFPISIQSQATIQYTFLFDADGNPCNSSSTSPSPTARPAPTACRSGQGLITTPRLSCSTAPAAPSLPPQLGSPLRCFFP